MLDAVVAGDLEAAFTWSGYAAAKAPVFGVFATVPFGPGPEDMTSWMLEGDGSRIHREAYEKLGVTGIPCGIQGAKGGGWFRGDLNTVEDFKGSACASAAIAGEIVSRLGATLVPLPAGEFFYQLQQGKVDGGEMSTPAIDAALGFDKLGLPYYMPGWQQPSAVLDFLMRKDKWEALPAAMRAQIETACRANIAWMLSRSPHMQGLALEKLKASGVVIKQWSPEIMKAFRTNSERSGASTGAERATSDPGLLPRALAPDQKRLHRAQRRRAGATTVRALPLRMAWFSNGLAGLHGSGQFGPDMTILSSQVDTRSDTFKRNAEAMRGLVDDLRRRTDQVRLGGGEESRKRHVARGKLLPRERVRALLDPGSPFLELSPLAALDMYDNEAPGSGVITGVGRVSGVGWSHSVDVSCRRGNCRVGIAGCGLLESGLSVLRLFGFTVLLCLGVVISLARAGERCVHRKSGAWYAITFRCPSAEVSHLTTF